MNSDAELQVIDGLEVALSGSTGTTARRPGGDPVEVGPHGLAILDAFREPAPVQDALNRLAVHARSLMSVGEMAGVIAQLQEAQLLVPKGAGARLPRTATGFSAAAIHVAMLDDRTRTAAFLAAIRLTVKPGDVVVDLGTGTGVLAIAAARAGARLVYAIEASGIADSAAAMFAASGVGDRISLVRGWSTDVVLGERADVLVTETLGDDPWAEGFLHLVADARRRFLLPGARLLPYRVRRLAQPVSVPQGRQRRLRFTPEAAREWTEWYGIDFTPLLASRAANGASWLKARDVMDWPRPCPAVVLAEVDVRLEASAPGTCEGRAVASESGVLDGALVCWEADLASGICLSTHPDAPEPVSWRSQLLLSRERLRVVAGETLALSITFGRSPQLEIAVVPGSSRDSQG